MKKFHDINHRNLFEQCPPDITPWEWRLFRQQYARAETLENLSHPVQIDIELNGGCNMSCPFCLHGYEDRPNTKMEFDQYKNLIDQAVKFGIRGVKLNYINEPMLRKDLEKFIAYAKSAGILNVYMVTNGTLLNRIRRHSILDSGITKIFISIDATTAGTYNRQRLSGKFDLVVKNVLDFMALRKFRRLEYPIVRVSFLRNKLNFSEEDEFVDFWNDRVDMVAVQRMNELPDVDSGLILD